MPGAGYANGSGTAKAFMPFDRFRVDLAKGAVLPGEGDKFRGAGGRIGVVNEALNSKPIHGFF